MIKEFVAERAPSFYKSMHYLKMKYYLFLGKYFPKKLIEKYYFNAYKKHINLIDPQDIDEKINWLKLYSDTTLWSKCADKEKVREYVKIKGLEDTLNDLYGIYNSPEEIPFASLPNEFVIKTTNGGGGNSVLIIKDKKDISIPNVKKTLYKWLKQPIGYQYAEYHYLKIRPKLIVEKYLHPNIGEKSLIDYKFNCFNGKVHSIFMCSDRDLNGHSVKYSVYDLNWELHPESIKAKYRTQKTYPKPSSLSLMIKYSKILSTGIPFVRVDWYENGNKPIFGEMTFTPAGGFQSFYTDEFRKELGDMLNFSK